MKKEPRIFDTILAMTFLIGLFLPLALTHNQDVSPIEKRKLVPFPELNWHSNTVTKFPSKFEAYFNDHFGFRDSLAQIHYLIDIKLKSSSMPRILIGEDGWLFFVDPMDGNSLEDFRGNDPFTLNQLKTWRYVLEDRYYWLKQQGIRYFFMVAPDKSTIYGEYIPSRFRRVSEQSRYDQFLEYMKDSEVPILDLRPALLQAKTNGLVYFKTNTHWNDVGAGVAQYEIIRRLAKYFPNLQPVTFHEQGFVLIEAAGDMTFMLNLSTQLKEVAPYLNPLPTCNPQIFEGSPKLQFKDRFYTDCNVDAPRSLVFHDSFFQALQPYMSQYFSKSYFTWINPTFDEFEHFVESTSPNIVIEERVERHLVFLPELASPQNKAYHAAAEATFQQGEVVYHWSGHQEEDIADMHELSVTAGGDNGYFFTSQGSDPYFTLPKITADANFNYSLKVTITAPEATSLKIFFPIAKHQFEYREEESFSGQLKTGENTFYVPLNGNELQGKIRIDLGKAQGKYLFKSLEIRAIKPVKSTHAE